MAFLVSPMGLPMVAAWLLGKLLFRKNRGVILSGKYHQRENLLKANVYFHASFRYNNSVKGRCAMTQHFFRDLTDREPVE